MNNVADKNGLCCCDNRNRACKANNALSDCEDERYSNVNDGRHKGVGKHGSVKCPGRENLGFHKNKAFEQERKG